MLASLIATCKMSDVNPVDYIARPCARSSTAIQKPDRDLMPWRFDRPSSLAA
jgi:transposase